MKRTNNQQKTEAAIKIKRHIKCMNKYAPSLQFFAMVFAGLIAFVALYIIPQTKTHHRQSVTIDLYTTLIDLENKIYSDAMMPKCEYLLSAIYFDEAIRPYEYKQKADLILSKITKWEIEIEWDEIPDLYDAIMKLGNSEETIDIYHKLIAGLNISDRIFFLAYRAFCLYQQKRISESEWKDYEMYIYDFAQSPLFLCALYINHKGRYFDEEFAIFIQQTYKTNCDYNVLIKSIYPEMFKKEWIKYINREE